MNNQRLNYMTLETSSGQIGYIKIGNGKPLIMLVGYSGNLLHWNSELVFKLAEEYTVYLLDNRLVGLSNSKNALSMAGLADDVADFITTLNLDAPLICGWSMGGIIAQALAMNYPTLLSGLILIVSQPDYSYTYGKLHELVSNLRDYPSKAHRDKLTELFFTGMPSIEFRKYLAKAVLPIDHYVYPFSRAAQELQDLAVATWKTNIELIKQIKLPTLITVAKNDLVTQPEASFYLHELIDSSKLISYPTGGHFFLHYYPHELAEQIKLFFSEQNLMLLKDNCHQKLG